MKALVLILPVKQLGASTHLFDLSVHSILYKGLLKMWYSQYCWFPNC